MTASFDFSKPETRSNRVVFYTDDETFAWLNAQADGTELGMSLMMHRIAKAAAQSSAVQPTPKRRASDAA